MLRAPIKSFRVCISHQSDHRIRVCISHQSERRFCLRGVQISTKIWEIRGERFVNWNHLLEWETLAFLCFERVLYRNGNGILCTVARSWLLFLHDESEWKIFQSNIAWSVDELHQAFWLRSSLTASFVARFIICWVCRLYFSGLVCSVLFLDECLIKINYGRFCVSFRWLEEMILWRRLCLAKDEFRYHR